jgi:hypothetical protein
MFYYCAIIVLSISTEIYKNKPVYLFLQKYLKLSTLRALAFQKTTSGTLL